MTRAVLRTTAAVVLNDPRHRPTALDRHKAVLFIATRRPFRSISKLSQCIHSFLIQVFPAMRVGISKFRSKRKRMHRFNQSASALHLSQPSLSATNFSSAMYVAPNATASSLRRAMLMPMSATLMLSHFSPLSMALRIPCIGAPSART